MCDEPVSSWVREIKCSLGVYPSAGQFVSQFVGSALCRRKTTTQTRFFFVFFVFLDMQNMTSCKHCILYRAKMSQISLLFHLPVEIQLHL